jgi:hypothetical protein
MSKPAKIIVPLLLILISLPLVAAGVVEPKTGTEYPDEITLESDGNSITMKATGVGLREKTFMKVDVYTIVSYVGSDAKLSGDLGEAIVALKAPKRIQMDLRRSFSREKLINAFVEVIEKNYEDTSPFAADMETFQAYFERDAEDGDVIIFDFCPKAGLSTQVNGEVKGIIENAAFTEALWTVWFGKEPANKDLKKKLLAELES